MKTKDLFILAVRLLGLYFFCAGLKGLDVPAFTDVTILKGDSLDDVVSALLPVGLNLVLAWWLLGCAFLNRRAYPDSPADSGRFTSPAEPAVPASRAEPREASNNLAAADKKLAALVGKPPGDYTSK